MYNFINITENEKDKAKNIENPVFFKGSLDIKNGILLEKKTKNIKIK